MSGPATPFLALVQRDLRLGLRRAGDIATVVLFFVLTVILFPLGVGPGPETLARIGPGVIWVAALLATLLSLDRLFQIDYEDGGLDLIAMARLPLELAVLAKVAACWLLTGLPLIAVSPLLALFMQMDWAVVPVMIASLALGTPVLCLVGAVGSALTLGARGGGVLLTTLVLPLYIPVLIFGTGAVDAALTDGPVVAHMSLLGGLLALALPLAPIAAAAALRQALE